MSVQTVETEAWGTTFDYNSGADPTAGSWTTISEVVDIDPPGPECTDMPTTHLTTSGHAKTYQAGLLEPGDVKITMNYAATIYNTLYAFLRTAKAYRVNYNDAVTTTPSRMTFAGYLKKIAPNKVENDKIVTFECTFKVSGLVSYTVAS